MEENKNYTTIEELDKRSQHKYLELLENGNIKTILTTIGKFVKETIDNDVLILEQMPNATMVCTKEEWEKIKHRELVESPQYLKLIGLTLYKNEQGNIDNRGSLHVIGTTKLHPYIRTVYDISQTTGADLPQKMDSEYLSKYFDYVKRSLEFITKGYSVKYKDDMSENSFLDRENKQIVIKNGISLIEVLQELINHSSKILLEGRKSEGITRNDKKNIDDLEHKMTVFVICERYGLPLPSYDFKEIENFSLEEKIKFKDNLAKVRSVVYQLTHNIENSIDFNIRAEQRKQEQANHESKPDYKSTSNANENEGF